MDGGRYGEVSIIRCSGIHIPRYRPECPSGPVPTQTAMPTDVKLSSIRHEAVIEGMN